MVASARVRRVFILVAFSLGVIRAARADPTDLVARPLVLDAGQAELALTAELNMQTREIARPLSLAPDAWYGVTSRLTVGVIHSSASVEQIQPGATFCVQTLNTAGCDRFYRGTGIDVLWSARGGAFAVAPHVRALLRDVDPAKPALALGALVRWQRGRFAVRGDPYLRIGLANTSQGNRTALWLPVELEVQPTCRWMIGFETGWNSDLAVWRDGYYVPAAFDVRARATRHLDVGLTFGFSSAYGPQATAKERVLFLRVGWRTSPATPTPR